MRAVADFFTSWNKPKVEPLKGKWDYPPTSKERAVFMDAEISGTISFLLFEKFKKLKRS
jgi:hypothetical protein